MASLPEKSCFKGKKLLTHSGELVDADKVLADMKVIACYFSAHWCPPCRQFTPKLKEFYERLGGSQLAIIFVSCDKSEHEMKNYFASQGDYLAVPFSDSELSEALQTACEVEGIPMLAVVDKNGKMLYGNGRSDVSSLNPQKAYEKWEKLSSA